MRKCAILIILFGFILLIRPLSAQTWDEAKRLTWTSGDSESPAIAVDSSNVIHLVWQNDISGNTEIYYKKSTNGGVTWVGDKRLTWNAGGSGYPAIAVDSTDTIHVVWNDYTPGNSEIFYKKSTNGGGSWSGTVRFTWNSEISSDPAIAVDSSDTIHVVWYDYSPGTAEILYKKSTDGGDSWSGTQRITWNPGVSFDPVIAVDSSDTIHLAWYNYIAGYPEIFYKKSTDGGGSWIGAKRLTWTSNASYDPAIALDSSNYIHVVWYNWTPAGNEIFYKRSTDGGTNWSISRRFTWNTGISCCPALTVDMSNNIHLVWYDKTSGNSEIYHKKSTNGGVNWSGTRRLTWNSGSSLYPVLDTDTSTNIHLVWFDKTPGNFEIYYKKGIQ
jgi:hypothetical protein